MKLSQLVSADVRGPGKVLFIACGGIADGAMTKKFKGVFADWDQLSIVDGEVMADGQRADGFDFVFVGTVGDHPQLHSCLKAMVEAHKIPNLFYGASTELNNKLLQTVLMRHNGVNQIKTVIASGEAVTAKELVQQLGLPLVSKITDGSQGKGVEKHDEIETVEKILKQDKQFIFQEFVPNEGDYRLFFIKEQLMYQVKRMAVDKNEFRNNISLGARHEESDIPQEAMALAMKAVRAMGFDFTGVDLIQHKETGEWYVIEINSAPQIAEEHISAVMNAIVKAMQR